MSKKLVDFRHIPGNYNELTKPQKSHFTSAVSFLSLQRSTLCCQLISL